MKRLIAYSIFFILLLCRYPSIGFAQIPNILYVVSYNDTAEHVYFCNGVRQNYLLFYFYLADLNQDPSDSNFTLDSLILTGDTSIFQSDSSKYTNYSVGSGSAQGDFYVPKQVGDDTLRISGYYGGQMASGTLIFHAIESPEVALAGTVNITKVIDSLDGYVITTQQNYQLERDTLHDRMGAYNVSNRPQTTFLVNHAVTIKSCGGATLVLVDTIGDFSEITLDSIPTLPYTFKSGANLVMPYTFIPHVVGNTHHYLRFHFSDGTLLVWSFEYQVFPASSVIGVTPSDADFGAYPNPFDRQTTITWNTDDPVSLPLSVSIYDALGRLVQNYEGAYLQHSLGALDVSCGLLPSGLYTALIRTMTTSSIIKLSVVH